MKSPVLVQFKKVFGHASMPARDRLGEGRHRQVCRVKGRSEWEGLCQHRGRWSKAAHENRAGSLRKG